MAVVRRYSELERLTSFDDRYEYLKLEGGVGRATFGFDRHINQAFYRSRQWRDVRNFVLYRDDGCDLGLLGHEIHVNPLIHHMNPMDVDNIIHGDEDILNPEFLITTSHRTHNAIHFGVENNQPRVVTERSPGDTKLW